MSSLLSSNVARNSQRELEQVSSDWLSRYCRKLVSQKLASLAGQPITLSDPVDQIRPEAGREVITVRHPRFYRRVVTGGALGAAESYIRGEWDCDDLTAILRVFVREIQKGFRFSRRYSWIKNGLSRAWHWARRNTMAGSRKNIAAHYDLGNDFFQLMLDETMTYSSGCFPTAETSLKDAQIEKYQRLGDYLELQEDDHLLEIGTGWGGMAVYAAMRYGCRVTTTTISQRQYDFARQRIDELGLDDRITVLRQDYRELEGQYDKLVSIEMIEAVGHRFLPKYFQRCCSLLKPGGKFAFQVISMPDQTYQDYLRRADFIQRYVFPGSCCPALGALVNAYSTADFRSEQTANIGPDYATTLRLWRENFEANLEPIRDLGYPEEFLRLWRYYLCYCEAGFAEKYLSNYQILLSKGKAS